MDKEIVIPVLPAVVAAILGVIAYFYQQYVKRINAYLVSIETMTHIVQTNRILLDYFVIEPLQLLPSFTQNDFPVFDDLIRETVYLHNKTILATRYGKKEAKATIELHRIEDILSDFRATLKSLIGKNILTFYGCKPTMHRTNHKNHNS